MTRLFYRPWVSYRHRGLIVLLLWRPLLILAAIGLVFSRLRIRSPWVFVAGAMLYLAWLVAEGFWRRR